MGSHKKHRKRSSSSSAEESRKRRKKSRKKPETSSSDTSSSSSSSDTSEEERRQRLKRAKKHKKKMKEIQKAQATTKVEDTSCDIPLSLMDQSKSMAPMTKDQWEKQQSVVRRVYDPSTGRNRLVKGDGEILEEIVSRDRHMQINKEATQGDGAFFQAQLCKK